MRKIALTRFSCYRTEIESASYDNELCNIQLARIDATRLLVVEFVCLCVCVPACLRACVPACLRACVPACLRACVPACLRACVPACLRACVSVSVLPPSKAANRNAQVGTA